MNKIILLFFLTFSSMAGDYGIHVCDSTRQLDSSDKYNPRVTSDSLGKEIERYFKTGRSDLVILEPALTNGHISYCDESKGGVVRKALDGLVFSDTLTLESYLIDCILMYGKPELFGKIQDALKKPDITANVKRRLNYIVKRQR